MGERGYISRMGILVAFDSCGRTWALWRCLGRALRRFARRWWGSVDLPELGVDDSSGRLVRFETDCPAMLVPIDGENEFVRGVRQGGGLIEDEHSAADLADGEAPVIHEQVDFDFG